MVPVLSVNGGPKLPTPSISNINPNSSTPHFPYLRTFHQQQQHTVIITIPIPIIKMPPKNHFLMYLPRAGFRYHKRTSVLRRYRNDIKVSTNPTTTPYPSNVVCTIAGYPTSLNLTTGGSNIGCC